MKKDLVPAQSTKLIYNGPCVLVTCQRDGKPNVFTVTWNTPVSIVPPIVAISCVKSNLSWEIIRETKEFTINVPGMELVDAVLGCGKKSGRDTDKFKVFGLTPEPGRVIRTPSIRECAGHLECRVTSEPAFGDFTLFIADVVAAYVDDAKFDATWIPEKARIINHMGDDLFAAAGETVRARPPA